MMARLGPASVAFLILVLAACAESPAREVVPRGDIFLRQDTSLIEGRVPRNATLGGLLRDHQLSEQLVVAMISTTRDVFDPRRLRAGQPYRIVRMVGGSFRRFEYDIDSDRFLRIIMQQGDPFDLKVEIVPFVKQRAEIAMYGEIDYEAPSLVEAVAGGGEGVLLAIAMAEVFAGEIDFNNDLRRGDSFNVLFEKLLQKDEYAGYGSIKAAEFNNDGRRILAFRFTPPGGKPAYYDEQGRSISKLFLRSPFRFEPQITSRFSYRRLHPVRGGIMPHLGIDYGAPHGIAVIAVANGVVTSAARSGGSGNMVRLRHTNGYETYYLHLSSFADGIRPGERVAQGETIGRVGATGLVTGPHLDFRIRKNGVFVNPLLEHRKLPPGDPLQPSHRAEFNVVRDSALKHLFWDAHATVTTSGYRR